MGRLLLCGTVAIVSGFWAYKIPELDVAILGEGGKGFFVFYSAALPILLLFIRFWSDESSLATRLTTLGTTLGAGIGLGIRLSIEAFSSSPFLIFPIFGTLIENTSADERGWLIANALFSIVAAFIALNMTEDDPSRNEAK